MSDASSDSPPEPPGGPADGDTGAAAGDGQGSGGGQIAQGTYDLLRGRLTTAANDLVGRANTLNNDRLDVFGSSQLELVATERVRTEANAVPRDVVSIGEQLVLAYNVAAGIKAEIRAEDVFAVHHLEVGETPSEITFSPNPEGLAGSVLADDQFHRDFDELYTYFKEANLQQLYRTAQRMLAVFRTGGGTNDIRVLRWQIETDGSLRYLDARGERDHRFPPNQDVEWTLTTRADHVGSSHVAIGDRIMVNPLGGNFEIRLDDGGEGTLLLSDRLQHADQSLADCQISWAQAGDLFLIDVLPYAETSHRYYIVNMLVHTAVRMDALGEAFRQLPDHQGIIFPDGVYLKTGEVRTFDLEVNDMELLEVTRSPNGEDVLYVFHERMGGRSILLPYNVVRQEVAAPIWCHGHSLFDDGTMVVFREEPSPTTIHPLQIWETPFASDEWYNAQPREANKFDRIGNAALVNGIADALALGRLVSEVEPSTAVYADVLASTGRFIDAHHWAGDETVGNLAEPANDIRMVAEQVIDEFERLQEVQASAAASLAEASEDTEKTLEDLRLSPPKTTEGYIDGLADIRRRIGHLHTIREQREINLERVDELIGSAETAYNDLAQSAAAHLSTDNAFVPYHERLTAIATQTPELLSSLEASELMEEVDGVAESMDLVAGTVGDLVVEDPRIRTSVLEQVSGVLAELNRVRAGVESKHEELVQSETGAAFATELGLFGQSIAAAVGRADTPEACDEALARLLLQLEQLETAGPRTDAQLDELNQRRDQVTEALSGRRQQLVDDRQQRAERLVSAADRTLVRVGERAQTLESVDDVNGFYAADPMVARVRKLVDDLRELGEPVRADELQSKLGASRDNAARALRDRQDLFDGEAVKLGRHRFSVDDRARELTIVPSGDQLNAVLTGTDLRLPVTGPGLDSLKELWDQPLSSESAVLYRSAFLAGDLLLDALHGGDDPARDDAIRTAIRNEDSDAVLRLVRAEVDNRLDEGYDRGVHDLDAAAILEGFGAVALQADNLTATSTTRAAAQIAWAHQFSDYHRDRWTDRGRAGATLGLDPVTVAELTEELAVDLVTARNPEADKQIEPSPHDYLIARYLMSELLNPEGLGFARTRAAGELADRFAASPDVRALVDGMDDDLIGVTTVLTDYVSREVREVERHLVDEVVAALVTPDLERRTIEVDLAVSVSGLIGRHQTFESGTITSQVDALLETVDHHRMATLPAHRAFAAARRDALTDVKNTLRVDELEPRVPEGFVRNQLIDQVYLPLIGDNLSRQIGTVDDRTGARSGLLMLLSPPGYGKTLLVEYLADRLGMALVKVSGPGLGHDVTSLDPGQAPSATAAREIERINLSFAVGTNVILYLDDIQHTNAEFLQRFIALCDAQRRVEGVWNGESTSFDLRGKRFAVVMAGNPYTESGERFRVPDMLANRADTYNLGDVLEGNADLFARSYLENALSSNPVLAPLVGTDPGDLERFFRAADGEPLDESSLKQSYSSAEANEIVAVLRHLRQVQDVVLTVNRQYIASAASADAYRTEPPFLLQGSYRNMARMASKLLPAMTSEEVDRIIDEHYTAESQALTGAAESNLLKLAEMRGTMTDEQRARWDDILLTFRRQQRLGGDERDPATRVVAAIENVAEALENPALAAASAPPPPPVEVEEEVEVEPVAPPPPPQIVMPPIEMPPVVIPPIEIPPIEVNVEVPDNATDPAAAAAMISAIERVADALSMQEPLAARAIDLLASEASKRRTRAANSKVGKSVPPRPPTPRPPTPAAPPSPAATRDPIKAASNAKKATKKRASKPKASGSQQAAKKSAGKKPAAQKQAAKAPAQKRKAAPPSPPARYRRDNKPTFPKPPAPPGSGKPPSRSPKSGGKPAGNKPKQPPAS